MEEVLDVVNVGNEFKLVRIKAYESIQSINAQIDKLVSELISLVNEAKDFTPWNFQSVSEFRESINEISLNDRFRYRTVLDIAKVLGKNYKGIQRAYFPIQDNYYAWCPHLSISKDGMIIYQGKNDWVNTLSEDWETITETRANKNKMDPLEYQSRHLRVTFVKSKDIFGKINYRFIGVYKYNEQKSTLRLRIYNRVDTKYTIK